ncbi:glycosyltransferase [Subtercola lobariae]|uniref:glycosyltransferase n=1 Tax=Subtercola lobariae TaxID=1588641 RepID=UPI00166F52E3|nr:glycosyltransferase [Subtercola lobariae]
MPPPSTDQTTPRRSEVDDWLISLTPTTESLQPEDIMSSVSWRVTVPLRTLRLRERVRAARSGTLVLDRSGHAAGSALKRARRALHSRLTEVAPVLLPSRAATGFSSVSLEELIELLTAAVCSSPNKADLWLLMIAVSGCFPDQAQLLGLWRDLRGVAGRDASMRILHHCGVWTARHHSRMRSMTLVTDQPVIFVDSTCRSGSVSAIARITRGLATEWKKVEPVTVAALDSDGVALRALGSAERKRVFAWNQGMIAERSDDQESAAAPSLVVPWNTTVVLPETPSGLGAETLAALARFSNNRTVALVYDLIPSISGHLVDRETSLRFVNYLSMLKHFDLAIAVSESAHTAFSEYSAELATQGLVGPRIGSAQLPLTRLGASLGDDSKQKPGLSPTTAPEPDDSPSRAENLPLVLTVGSNEYRRNQLTVIFAAEVLWREGKRFRLRIMGGEGDAEYSAVRDAVATLSAAGREIELSTDVTDDELALAYDAARFTVYVPLHDGAPLVLAESLAWRTPAVTTNYGSTADLAAAGGCLVVDPHSDDEVIAAVRTLLNDEELSLLHREIDERPARTWADFCSDVRTALTDESAVAR